MIYATFRESMIHILKSFIGCRFNSYECVPVGSGTYGNLRIQIDGEPYEIRNQQNVVLMNGESVDISTFSIEKATGAFKPICGNKIEKNMIEDTVQDICIVQDAIVLPNAEEIRMDMAVTFKTEHTVTMFSRDAWFSEFITISNTSDLDAIYPIFRAKDSWRNGDEAEVMIHRTIKSLKTEP